MAQHRNHPVFLGGGDEYVKPTRDGRVRLGGFDVTDDDLADPVIEQNRIPDLIRALVEAYRA